MPHRCPTLCRPLLPLAALVLGSLLGTTHPGAAAGEKKGGGDEPRITIGFSPIMQFGFQLTDKAGTQQKITFHEQGVSNLTFVQVDGKIHVFGLTQDDIDKSGKPLPEGLQVGKWVTKEAALGKGKDGKVRRGKKSVWAVGKVEITQTVEVVRSEKGALDACMVTYAVENKGEKAQKVAVRVMLDTFIADNDGHPFAVPGKDRLITTSADFRAGKDMPALVQALQRANLKDPGLVATFTLRPGGAVQGPDRFSITQLPMGRADVARWDLPVRDIGGDAAVVFYWEARAMKGGERRQVGFGYGGGPVSLGKGGKKAPPTDDKK